MFDQTLLAIPIIAIAGHHANKLGRLPRNLVILYTALNVTLILLAMASSPWSFVPAPIVIAFLLYREARAGNNFSPACNTVTWGANREHSTQVTASGRLLSVAGQQA